MKVFGLSKIIWSAIFLAIQVLNFGCLVGAMDYDYWFKQKWTYGGNTYIFKGGLLGPISSLSNDCDDTDSYQQCYDNCDRYCKRYKNWYGAGVGYVFLDTIGSIIVVIIAVILVLDLLKVRFLRKIINVFTTAILMIIVFILHFLAFVIWAGAVDLKFESCSHNILYSGVESVCGEGGAAFALWNLFYLFFINIPYFLIALKIKKEEQNEEGEKGNSELLPE